MTKFHNFSSIRPCNIRPVSADYRLKVIQQPEQARATGRSKKFTGRRTIDPPPVIQVSLLHSPGSSANPDSSSVRTANSIYSNPDPMDVDSEKGPAALDAGSTSSASSRPANIIRHTLNPLILVATLIEETEPPSSASQPQQNDPENSPETHQHSQKLNMASTIYNVITGNDKHHDDFPSSNGASANGSSLHSTNSNTAISSTFTNSSGSSNNNNSTGSSSSKGNASGVDSCDNLVGTTSVVANMVSDDGLSYDEMKAVFIFSNLSVKQEGSYKLRFTLYEYTSYNTLYHHHSFVPSTDSTASPGRIIHRGGMDSNVFKVYTAKKFPGLNTSSKLSFDLKSSGTKIKVRHSIRSGNKKNNQQQQDSSSSHQNSISGTIPTITTTDTTVLTDTKLLPVHENPLEIDGDSNADDQDQLNSNDRNDKNSNNQNANNNNGSSAYYTFLKNRQPLMGRTYIFGKRKNSSNNNEKNGPQIPSSLTELPVKGHIDRYVSHQISKNNDDIEMSDNYHVSQAAPSESKRSFDSIYSSNNSNNNNNNEYHYGTNNTYYSNQSIHSRQSSSNSNNMYYNNSNNNHYYHASGDIYHHHNNNNTLGMPPLRPTISNSSTTSSLQSAISSIASTNNSNTTNTPASTARHTIGSFFASFHRSSNKDVLNSNENKSPTLSVSPLKILSDVSSKQLPLSAGSTGRPSPPVSPQYFTNHNNNNNSSMMYYLQNHAGSSNTVSSHGSSVPYQPMAQNTTAATTHKIRSRNNTVVSNSSSQNFGFNFSSSQNGNSHHQDDPFSNRNSFGSNSNNLYAGNGNGDLTKRSSVSSLNNRSSSFINNNNSNNNNNSTYNNGGTTPIPLPNNSGAMTPTHNSNFSANNLLSASGGGNTVNGSASTSRRPSESLLFSQTTPIYFQTQSINSFASSLNLNNHNHNNGSNIQLGASNNNNNNNMQSSDAAYCRESNVLYTGYGSQRSDDYDDNGGDDTNMEDVELPTPKKTKTDPKYKTAIMRISNIIN